MFRAAGSFHECTDLSSFRNSPEPGFPIYSALDSSHVSMTVQKVSVLRDVGEVGLAGGGAVAVGEIDT